MKDLFRFRILNDPFDKVYTARKMDGRDVYNINWTDNGKLFDHDFCYIDEVKENLDDGIWLEEPGDGSIVCPAGKTLEQSVQEKWEDINKDRDLLIQRLIDDKPVKKARIAVSSKTFDESIAERWARITANNEKLMKLLDEK